MPSSGNIFISVKDLDKFAAKTLARQLSAMNFKLIATSGTATALTSEGITVERINKVGEGQPHIVDALQNGEVDLVINTADGAKEIIDSRSLRQAAVKNQIPYYTTIAGARAAVAAITALRSDLLEVMPIQFYLDASV